jgi:hypothetical protein
MRDESTDWLLLAALVLHTLARPKNRILNMVVGRPAQKSDIKMVVGRPAQKSDIKMVVGRGGFGLVLRPILREALRGGK